MSPSQNIQDDKLKKKHVCRNNYIKVIWTSIIQSQICSKFSRSLNAEYIIEDCRNCLRHQDNPLKFEKTTLQSSLKKNYVHIIGAHVIPHEKLITTPQSIHYLLFLFLKVVQFKLNHLIASFMILEMQSQQIVRLLVMVFTPRCR